MGIHPTVSVAPVDDNARHVRDAFAPRGGGAEEDEISLGNRSGIPICVAW